MKKLWLVVGLCGLMLIPLTLTATPALALLTPIFNSGETSLIDPGGILDSIYGLSNLTRIDDSLDQIWHMSGSSATATAQAKYASNSQYLYWGPNTSSLNFILSITSNPVPGHPLGTPSATFSATGAFRFYDDPNGGSDPPLWSSLQGENIAYSAESAGFDRMVTWRITGNSGYLSNVIGNYVMAWEDKDDNDYNDMVYEFANITTNVPEPSSMILLGIGLIGLAGGAVKKRFKA